MSAIHVFIAIHGMTSRSAPYDPTAQYQEFWYQLCRAQPKLDKLITGQIFVQWGHETPNQGTPLREDQQLTRAELFLREQVAYEKVRAKPGPNNVTLSGLFGNEVGVPILRQLVQKIREGVVMFGLGDVVYYCAEEGEKHVREQVYNQVLGRLDPYLKEKDVRLHIFGHSLGVTISHDFLYGLFAPRHKPDFVRERQGGGPAANAFSMWRSKARKGELKLGSLASAASQLPLLSMRKQKLVTLFSSGQKLCPCDIGVVGSRTKWKIFYDVDDLLGFATRNLYDPNDAIMDIQVDSGDLPESAHDRYWTNKTVIAETARGIIANSR